jgi:NADH dehydrogenase [ubiquinone] 1 alpha subcomplex assembly factor 1
MFAQLCRRSGCIIRTNNTNNAFRSIHTTTVNSTFWEREKKSGYGKKYPAIPTKSMILDGLKELKSEIQMWREEVKEKFESDPILVFRPGEVDVAWKFSGLLRDY